MNGLKLSVVALGLSLAFACNSEKKSDAEADTAKATDTTAKQDTAKTAKDVPASAKADPKPDEEKAEAEDTAEKAAEGTAEEKAEEKDTAEEQPGE